MLGAGANLAEQDVHFWKSSVSNSSSGDLAIGTDGYRVTVSEGLPADLSLGMCDGMAGAPLARIEQRTILSNGFPQVHRHRHRADA